MPMHINWTRADLSHWGEFIETPTGRYTKHWDYKDGRKNPDGCAFSLDFNGHQIAREIDGPTIDEAEAKVDKLVFDHMREHMPAFLEEHTAIAKSRALAEA